MVDNDARPAPFDVVAADPWSHVTPPLACDHDELWMVDPDAPVGDELAWECRTAAGMAESLSDEQVLAVVAGAERMARWATALRTRMLGEFAHRHPPGSRAAPPDADPRAVTAVSRWLPDQVAMVLQVSREHARSLLGEAARFRVVLPSTLAEWEAGRIDGRVAAAIAQTTLVLDDGVAARVEAEVLPRAAEGASYRSVRDRLRRTIARHDPDGARRRHERASADRRISISRGEDGMAALWLSSTAAQTEASWQCLDRLARSLGADDPRTLDQRRVDVAHQLLQGTLTVTDMSVVQAAVEGVLAAASVGAGGPASAVVPAVEVVGPGVAGAPAVAVSSGAACPVRALAQPDGVVPDGGLSDGALSDGGLPVVSAEVLAEVVAQVLATKPDPNTVIGRKPLIQVVVGLDTLLGGDRPAELVGHGTIPAVTARALAADGVWKRLVIDPLSGVCRDHGRTTYRPPDGLADDVKARDGTCRGPVCEKPIRDLDHLVPWGADGVTSEENLHGLCQGHHKLKDAPGWQVLAGVDGSLTWISPCGWSETSRPKDYRPFIDPMPAPGESAEPPAPRASGEPCLDGVTDIEEDAPAPF